MKDCKLEIKKGILDSIFSKHVDGRKTYKRTDDYNKIQILPGKDSKAKSFNQAMKIAEELSDRIFKNTDGHVFGTIESYSEADPIKVEFNVTEGFIEYKLQEELDLQNQKNIEENSDFGDLELLSDSIIPTVSSYNMVQELGNNQFEANGEVYPTYEDAENALKKSEEEYVLFNTSKESQVNYSLKAIDILQSGKAKQVFEKGKKNNWNLNKILTELQIPKEQKQIILNKNITDREKIITSLLVDNSFVVEINTAKSPPNSQVTDEGGNGFTIGNKTYVAEQGYTSPEYFIYENGNRIEITEKEFNDVKNNSIIKEPTQYYSNLTVNEDFYKNHPDWEYKEQRITTPNITPNIKGHAQFTDNNDIGWFRAWYNRKTGEVHVLEVQSDLFQKGRDKEDLIYKNYKNKKELENQIQKAKESNDNPKYIKILESELENQERYKLLPDNQFLQLLNKKGNWINFFIQSIVQDSVKKGYEKVLFPKGDTASKIEGHTTLEEFKKEKEDRIKYLTSIPNTIKELKSEIKKIDNIKIPVNLNRIDTKNEYLDIQYVKIKGNWYQETEGDLGDVIFEEDVILSIYKDTFTENDPFYYEDLKNKLKNLESYNIKYEINQLKQEIKKVEEEGFGTLKPIYNFYENRVTNILKKLYDVKEVTDEYGNKWNEIDITVEENINNKILLNTQIKLNNLNNSNIHNTALKERYNRLSELKNKSNKNQLEILEYQNLKEEFKYIKSSNHFKNILESKNTKDFNEYRNLKLSSLIDNFIKDYNISKVDLDRYSSNYERKTGKKLYINGLANITEKTIAFIDDIEIATEEVAHFIIAMLPKTSKEYIAINNYLEKTPEYKRYYNEYLNIYGNSSLAREEIIGKVLANKITGKKEKLPLSLKEILNNIIKYITNLINPADRLYYRTAINDLKRAFFTENLDYYISEENINFDKNLKELYSLNFDKIYNDNEDYYKAKDINQERLEEVVGNQIKRLIKELKKRTQIELKLNKQNEAHKLFTISNRLLDILNTGNSINTLFEFLNENEAHITNIKLTLDNLSEEINKDVIPAIKEDLELNTIQSRHAAIEKVKLSLKYLYSLYEYSNFLKDNFKFEEIDSEEIKEFQDTIKLIKENKEYINQDQTEFLDLVDKVFKNYRQEQRLTLASNIDELYKNQVLQLLKLWAKAEGSNIDLPNIDDDAFITNSANDVGVKNSLLNNLYQFKFKGEGKQTDKFLQQVSQFVNNIYRTSIAETDKERKDFNVYLDSYIENGGNLQNSEWLSSKDKNGKNTGKLLLEDDYLKLNEHLANKVYNALMSNTKIPSDIKDKITKNYKHNSYLELLGNIDKITQRENKKNNSIYKNIKVYLKNVHSQYYFELLKANTNNDKLNEELNEELDSITSKLKARVKRQEVDVFNDSFSNRYPIKKVYLFSKALEAKILEYKEDMLAKHVTVETDGFMKQQQIDFVESLVRKYAENIGYQLDDEGNLMDHFINFHKLGDTSIFKLDNNHPNAESIFKNEEYLKLQSLSRSGNKLAQSKLNMLDYIKKYNRNHNLPANHLPHKYKEKEEYSIISNLFGLNNTKYRNVEHYLKWFGAMGLTLSYGISMASLFIPFTTAFGIDSLGRLIHLTIEENGNPFKAVKSWLKSYSIEIFNEGELLFTQQLNNIQKNSKYKDGINKDNIKEAIKDIKIYVNDILKKMFDHLLGNKTDKTPIYHFENPSVIPHLFMSNISYTLRSKDFLGAFHTSLSANNEFEIKTKNEAVIKSLVAFNDRRNNNTSMEDYIKNSSKYLKERYIDRFWHNKVYKDNNEKLLNLVKFMIGKTSFLYLTGTITSALTNKTQGVLMNSSFGNNSVKSYFKALRDIFKFGKKALGNEYNAEEEILVEKIKNVLPSELHHTIRNYNYTTNQLLSEFNLNDTSILQSFGEDIIVRQLINQFLEDHDIIDTDGNKIDIRKYLKVNDKVNKDGIFSFDLEKYKKNTGKNLYFKGVENFDNLEFIKNNIANIEESGIWQSNIHSYKKEPLTESDLHFYFDYNFINKIDQAKRDRQGEFNPLLKPHAVTSGFFGLPLGLLVFQFRNHMISNARITAKNVKGSLEVLKSLADLNNNPNITDYQKAARKLNISEAFIGVQLLEKVLERLKKTSVSQRYINKLVNNIHKNKPELSKLDIKANVYNEYLKNKQEFYQNYEYLKNTQKIGLILLILYQGLAKLITGLRKEDKDDLFYTFLDYNLQKSQSEYIRTLNPTLDLSSLGLQIDSKYYRGYAEVNKPVLDPADLLVTFDSWAFLFNYMRWLFPGVSYYDTETKNALENLQEEANASGYDLEIPNYPAKVRLNHKKEVIVGKNGKYFYTDSDGIIKAKSTVTDDLINELFGKQIYNALQLDPEKDYKKQLDAGFLHNLNAKYRTTYYYKFHESIDKEYEND